MNEKMISLSFQDIKDRKNLEQSELRPIETYEFNQPYVLTKEQLNEVFVWLLKEYGLLIEGTDLNQKLRSVKTRLSNSGVYDESLNRDITYIFKSVSMLIFDNLKTKEQRRYYLILKHPPRTAEEYHMETPDQNFSKHFQHEKAKQIGFGFSFELYMGKEPVFTEITAQKIVTALKKHGFIPPGKFENPDDFIHAIINHINSQRPSGLILESEDKNHEIVITLISDPKQIHERIKIGMEIYNKFRVRGEPTTGRPFTSEEDKAEAKSVLSNIRSDIYTS